MASYLTRDNSASAKHTMRKRQLSKYCKTMQNSDPNPPNLGRFVPTEDGTKGRELCKKRA